MLDEELAYFNRNRGKWLGLYPDQFALIKGKRLLGKFTTLDEAFKEGIRLLGNQPFLIRQITEREPIASHPALTVGVLNAHPQP